MAMFADVTAEHVAPTMIEQCERMRPDLVIYEAMNTGAGVAASVLGIPAAAYAIALASSVYGSLHAATAGYQRDLWLQRGRTPPEANGLLAAALINPAPPTLQGPRRHRSSDRFRSGRWPTTNPAPRCRHGSASDERSPGSISRSARCRSAQSRYSAVRLLRLRRSMWTSW